MTTPQLPTSETIRPGQTIVVEGKIDYRSYISEILSGSKLVEVNKRSLSQYPKEVPHTVVRLTNAKVVYADPSAPSWEEYFIEHSGFFDFSKNPEKGKGYEAYNITRNLPALLAPTAEGSTELVQINPVEGELKVGTPVRIVLRTYESKNAKTGKPNARKGISLDAVILFTPEVPYYKPAGGGSLDLSAYGLTAPSTITNVTPEAAPEAPAGPPAPAAAPAVPSAPAAPAAPAAPQAAAPQAPIVTPNPAYEVASPIQPSAPVAPAPAAPETPAAPAAPAATEASDPFAGAPAASNWTAGIQPPA